jgi:type II secretory pathway component PulF
LCWNFSFISRKEAGISSFTLYVAGGVITCKANRPYQIFKKPLSFTKCRDTLVPKISTVFMRLNVELPLPTQILIGMSQALTQYTIFVALGAVAFCAGIFLLYREKKREFLHLLFMLPVVSLLAKQIDLTRFSRSLYLLLNAGIPIAAALELTQEVVLKREVAESIAHCKEVVLAGSQLSEGLKKAKGIFPNIMIKITEAGEKSGSLDKSMQDVSDYLDYQVEKTIMIITTFVFTSFMATLWIAKAFHYDDMSVEEELLYSKTLSNKVI